MGCYNRKTSPSLWERGGQREKREREREREAEGRRQGGGGREREREGETDSERVGGVVLSTHTGTATYFGWLG